jgi:hypothetical protein
VGVVLARIANTVGTTITDLVEARLEAEGGGSEYKRWPEIESGN